MSNTGLEGFADTVTTTASRSITQPTSRTIEGLEDVAPGSWVDRRGKQEFGRNIDVVVLEAKTARKLFHPMNSGQKGLRCWSDDGEFPSPGVKTPVSAQCTGCPEERNDKMARVLCLDVKQTQERGEPVTFYYEATKTAIKPVGLYVKAIRERGKPARDFMVTLAAEKEENEKGKWFKPAFKNIRQTPTELKQFAEDAFSGLSQDASELGEEAQLGGNDGEF